MIQNKHLLFSFFIVSLTASAHSFDGTAFFQTIKKSTQGFGDSLKGSLRSDRARDFALLDYYNGESIKIETQEKNENPIPAKSVTPVEIKKSEKVEQPRVTFLPTKTAKSVTIGALVDRKETHNPEKMANLQKKEKQQEATFFDYATPSNVGIGGAVVLCLCAFGWYITSK